MFAAAIVLGSVALALLFTRRDRDGAGGVIDLAAVRWQAPTDFLLKVPGAELLRTVPQLGRVSLEGRIL